KRIRVEDLTLHVVRLVDVGHAAEAGDRSLPHVTDQEVGVESFLDRDGLPRAILHFEHHLKPGAEHATMTRREFSSTQPPRDIVGPECERDRDRYTVGTLDGFHGPLRGPREPVVWRVRIARARAEPREDHRHAAADRLARDELAALAQKQHALMPGWAIARDVRAMEIDMALAGGRGDRSTYEPA